MPTRNGQFEYPTEDWAVGKMAKVGPMKGGDPGREFRELEGVRKRKESQASENKAQPDGSEYLAHTDWYIKNYGTDVSKWPYDPRTEHPDIQKKWKVPLPDYLKMEQTPGQGAAPGPQWSTG